MPAAAAGTWQPGRLPNSPPILERMQRLRVLRAVGCSNVKGPLMAVGDHYRAKALELLAHAETERDLLARAELENLAAAYLRLAEQAERNSGLTIEFDPIPEKDNPKRKP